MADVGDIEDLYESLPTHKLHVHMMAGGLAGIGEHCLMYPLDSVKTRMQSLCANCPEVNCRTPYGGLRSIMKREGILRPLKGVGVVATGAVPAHALYFTAYEKSKLWLSGGKQAHNPLVHMAAGTIATVMHDAVMNPVEVIKQRMQMFASPYGNSLQCCRCVYRTEGLAAFYRSYTTQLVMNVPFHSVHFAAYEFLQDILNPQHQYDPKSHVIAGGVAGGLAAAVTTPLDVCKTVLNTQELLVQNHGDTTRCPASVTGLRGAFVAILKNRGIFGLFSGLQARVLFQIPSTAISWSVYEFFKYFLSQQESKLDSGSKSVALQTGDGEAAEQLLMLKANSAVATY